MQSSTKLEQLLECLIKVIGRAAINKSDVARIVGTGKKQIEAFNLCDGKNSQKEIAKRTGLDQGNLSRTAVRWVEAGVAFWVGEGKNTCLLHVYPISHSDAKISKPKRTKPGKKG